MGYVATKAVYGRKPPEWSVKLMGSRVGVNAADANKVPTNDDDTVIVPHETEVVERKMTATYGGIPCMSVVISPSASVNTPEEQSIWSSNVRLLCSMCPITYPVKPGDGNEGRFTMEVAPEAWRRIYQPTAF